MNVPANSDSPSALAAAISPRLVSRTGLGRSRLLAAYGQGLVTLPESVIATMRALARTDAAHRELVAADPRTARLDYEDRMREALSDGN
jgi:hypothetical protein